MKQLHKSLLTMLLLVAVASALAAWALWSRQQQQQQQQQEEKKFQPFSLERQRVDRIVIQRSRGRIELAGGEQGWRIVSPLQDYADTTEVYQLLTAAADLRVDRLLPGANPAYLPEQTVPEQPAPEQPVREQLVQLQLTPPKTSLTFYQGPRQFTIHLGSRSGFDQGVYIRAGEVIASAPLALLNARAAMALDRSLLQLRDKRLLPMAASEVVEFALLIHSSAVDGLSYRLRKNKEPDGRWRLLQPEVTDADGDIVREILAAASSVRFTKVVSPEASSKTLRHHRLDQPDYSLVASNGQQQLRVDIAGHALGERVAYRLGRGEITDAPTDLLPKLNRTPFELEEKRALIFPSEQVFSIKIDLGDGKFVVLERDPGDGSTSRWRILAPKPGVAKHWVVSSLLLTLGNLKAKRFVPVDLTASSGTNPLEPYGLDQPQRIFTLFADDKTEMGTLLVGAQKVDICYVMARGGDRLLAVDRAVAEELLVSTQDLQLD